jgi:FlaA1/EpsC-like NDP-sugar epimerase
VLFSDGSLPASFIERLEQRQPLAGPSDVERYFMTFEEAARLCLLAASHPVSGEILVPRMGPADRLRFDTIAERLLGAQGLRAKHYGTDATAAIANLEADESAGQWPCLFSPSTTSGEKEAEEFQADGDTVSAAQPYAQLQVLRPAAVQSLDQLERELNALARELADFNWLMDHSKADLVSTLSRLVPGFRHHETGASLDQKL